MPGSQRSAPQACDATIRIAGGAFAMGCADFYADEAPVRQVSVARFLIDRAPVTNAQSLPSWPQPAMWRWQIKCLTPRTIRGSFPR